MYFVPVTVETLEALGEEAAAFFSRRTAAPTSLTRESPSRSSAFLFQRLSIAIQRTTLLPSLELPPSSAKLDDIFYS